LLRTIEVIEVKQFGSLRGGISSRRVAEISEQADAQFDERINDYYTKWNHCMI